MHGWIAWAVLIPSLFAGHSESLTEFVPVVYDVQTATPYQCQDKMKQDVSQVLDTVSSCLTKQVFTSCKDILDSCGENVPSDYYEITSGNGTVLNVYCDMDGSNCDDKGGWTRVAWLDMSDPSEECPGAWTTAVYNDIRVCAKWGGCSINFYYTHGIPYSEVCGMARGYQYGSNDAFRPYFSGGFNGVGSDGRYTDGVQITYDNERQHIWSYAAADNSNGRDTYTCPCNEGSRSLTPTYVGNYYYCESASANGWTNTFYDGDVLWDGEQCDFREGPCCTNPKLPWFYRELGKTVTHNIEVRLCSDQSIDNERVTLERFQLYIR